MNEKQFLNNFYLWYVVINYILTENTVTFLEKQALWTLSEDHKSEENDLLVLEWPCK